MRCVICDADKFDTDELINNHVPHNVNYVMWLLS